MTQAKEQAYLDDWNTRLEAAEQMVPLIGDLWRNHVPTYVYGLPLYVKTPIEIIKAHRAARQLAASEITTRDILPYVKAVAALSLKPAKIDLGRLRARHLEAGGDVAAFVADELAALRGDVEPLRDEPQDVVLYGFGRIGRLLTRILVERMGGGEKFRLKAVVVRGNRPGDLEKRASLLRRDSVHGPFNGTIVLDEEDNAMVVNGNFIRLLNANAPDEIDYTAHGIHDAIILDNTGNWRDREGLGLHLKAPGAKSVIVTAPGKGDVPNIVFGVNHALAEGKNILSAASCTTNAIVPVLKAMNDRYGIKHGHVETCHSYTNDQNLIDNYHPKARRGRGAPLNMVITETGAAKAVAKALPELAGKLTGNAIRVPTPNVSLAILHLGLEKEVTRDELNDFMRRCSLQGPLRYQIDYTTSPDIVSSDLVGNRAASIIDSEATIAEGDRVVLYVWYDNEFGYACQVIRLMEALAGVRPRAYPAEG
ncbi:MAG: glyceraldehyde-3-phosphate dehydrogenase [Polyangiaceae bacterium]